MKYFLSAGEHSGDMHAAVLIKKIKELDSEAGFWGMGGPLMAKEGMEILYDPTKTSTIGFWEAGKNYFRFKSYLKKFTRFLRETRPDIMIWVDFGGFNLRLAQRAKDLGIPVVCLFSPSAWAYGRNRAAHMAKSVAHLAAVLPFEADFYRESGLKVTYVGHPLLDRVKPDTLPQVWRREKGVREGDTVIALMPGSRQQEVTILLPIILKAANTLDKKREGFKFFLPVAPTIDRSIILNYMGSFPGNIELIPGDQAYNLMAAADFAVIASGTSTLEAAIMELPMVMVYRVSKFSAFLYRKLINKEAKEGPILIALPNLIAGKMIVPELVQENLTVERLSGEMTNILDNYNNARDTMMNELQQVREKLGAPGVMERVAQLVLAEAKAR